MKKLMQGVLICCFGLILMIPFTFASREENVLSESENRYLSSLPTASFGTEEYKEQLEDWFNDNLGGRQEFLDLRSILLYKGLNIVSSEKVMKGKNGWLFYTLDNNVEIARGTYPLDEDLLNEIAEVQQATSDYYKSLGKTYVLLITPSKVSIYPEYLYGQYSESITPIDIVCQYLKEHTDVIIVNPKKYLLDAKEFGQVYWKTDTHLTSWGAQYVYRALIDTLNEAGITEFVPVETMKSTGQMGTDLMNMLGLGKLFIEEGDVLQFSMTSKEVKTGDYYETIQDKVKNGTGGVISYAMYENTNIENDREIFLYGTSQLLPIRKIPQLLAENFSRVTYLYQSPVNPIYDVDCISTADIVVAAVGERSVNNVLNKLPKGISEIFTKLPEIETREIIAERNIMYLERINDMQINNKMSGLNSAISISDGICNMSGWAVDFTNNLAFSDIYILVGENIIKGSYGFSRNDVANHFGNENYTYVGFEVNFSSSVIYDTNGELVDEISFILVGKDGTFMYEPIVYKLGGEE